MFYLLLQTVHHSLLGLSCSKVDLPEGISRRITPDCSSVNNILILLTLLFILLRVAFYTLFERKLLSLRQNRLGPNQVVIWGILQPILDGVKLLTKEWLFPNKRRRGYFLIPIIIFFSITILWFNILSLEFSPLQISLLYLLLLVGVIVYAAILRGWVSISKYGAIGRVRRVSQSISYEILFTTLLLIYLINLNFLSLKRGNINVIAIVLLALCVLVECNRHPFDFREGESELIRGFNVEYGRRGFVLLFLAEYGIIIFFSFLVGQLATLGGASLIFLILIRSTLPRFRYDKLIEIIWTISLPLSCFLLFSYLYL